MAAPVDDDKSCDEGPAPLDENRGVMNDFHLDQYHPCERHCARRAAAPY
jgi:hypothetical protein